MMQGDENLKKIKKLYLFRKIREYIAPKKQVLDTVRKE